MVDKITTINVMNVARVDIDNAEIDTTVMETWLFVLLEAKWKFKYMYMAHCIFFLGLTLG